MEINPEVSQFKSFTFSSLWFYSGEKPTSFVRSSESEMKKLISNAALESKKKTHLNLLFAQYKKLQGGLWKKQTPFWLSVFHVLGWEIVLKISHSPCKLRFSGQIFIFRTITQMRTLSADILAAWRGLYIKQRNYIEQDDMDMSWLFQSRFFGVKNFHQRIF